MGEVGGGGTFGCGFLHPSKEHQQHPSFDVQMTEHRRTHGLDHFVVEMGRVAHLDDVVLLSVREVQGSLFFGLHGIAFRYKGKVG